jgi:hypothetical protein
MKITKENAVAQVTSSVSSIFTKEDVLFLINSIEVKKGISPQDIERVVDNIMSSLENNSDELVDRDSCEFEISYNNRLEVTEVPIQFDYIREAIENNLCEFEGGEEEDDQEDDQTGYVESECN